MTKIENSIYTKEYCRSLLASKYAELCASGSERYPRRSDFSEREVMAIKSFLGPWPRALEAAGIKPERTDGHAEHRLEKRIRAKRRKTEEKLAAKSERNE